jgi:orotate phosphoribosyltransferase-like protein
MQREYRHIQEYEKEILELLSKGMTQCEVGEELGFSKKQIKNFMARYHQKEQKIAAGMALRKKGRPCKYTSIFEADKLAELRYKLARKIKQLEM